MKKNFFGTDGIRGKTGTFPITPDFFVKVGFAAGKVLTKYYKKENNPTVVIGKDTRISGYMFESALEAGFSAAGVDVYLTGPLPTPAVAFLTKKMNADIGVSITASHNHFEDNGIKFFSDKGTKLSENIEHEIEKIADDDIEVLPSNKLGRAKRLDDARDQYIQFCVNSIPEGTKFDNLKIVLDCAHGATYKVAPSIFKCLGANITVINNSPDGLNINKDAGSINPHILQQEVLKQKADMGIAFDGDGDRLIMIDDMGELIDGDQILYLIINLYRANNKKFGGVVGTLMTNLALEEKCKELSTPFFRADVGDKYVAKALRDKGWLIGGENSGHIVLLDKHSTGDGIISSLQLLLFLLTTNKSLHESLKEFPMYPQRLINIPLQKGFDANAKEILSLVDEASDMMKSSGRVLIRPSGTQPIVRVMTEGPQKDLVDNAAEYIAESISNLNP